MSRIGKLPVKLGAARANLLGTTLQVEGSKGKLQLVLRPEVKVAVTPEEIVVTRLDDQAKTKAYHGLTRALIQNMVTGVTSGFSKSLEIRGVGYRASVQGKKLVLSLGFSYPVEVAVPEEITVKVEKEILTISGCDKLAVGQFAAQVRALKPPEPYQGRGVRYLGEYVKQKVGKRATTTTA